MEEHSEATVRKYANAVTDFYNFLPAGKEASKEHLLEWKAQISGHCKASTVNVMISAVNSFFESVSRHDLRIRQIKTQRKIYRDRNRELTKEEYFRLLDTALESGNLRLYYLMQTLASTGIRISELQFITVESLKNGQEVVDCKGKQRVVFIMQKLCSELLEYCEKNGISTGSVFVTKYGNPMDRSNIWKDIRKLCDTANVEKSKVFPHNFRHLFAVTYYRQQKDMAKLADLLGHSSIDTTRIYIMESGTEHERQIEQLGLVV